MTRARVTLLAWAGAAAASMCLMHGCATTPDRDDTLRTIADEIEELRKWREEEIRKCNGDVACIQKVQEIYYELSKMAWQLRQKVIDEAWQDARERRKELEKRLRELIPQWPDLEKLLEPLLTYSSIYEGEGVISASPVAVGDGGVITSVTNYTLNGVFDFHNPDLGNPTLTLAGSINVAGSPVAPGQYREFTTGSVTIGLPGNAQFQTSLHVPTQNAGLRSWISTDVTGSGWLRLVLAFDDDDLEGSWGALMSSPTAIRLPVMMQANGTLEFDMPLGVIGDEYPYWGWAASDYDQDGVLDSSLDYAAFLSGFQAQDALADTTADGKWTNDDIDLWWDHFWADVANQ